MCEKKAESSGEVKNLLSQKPISFNSLWHELHNKKRPCPDDTCDLCDCARLRQQYLELVERNKRLEERARQLAAIQQMPEGTVNPVFEQFMKFLLSNGCDPEIEQPMRRLLGKISTEKFTQFMQEMMATGEVDPTLKALIQKTPAEGASPDN